MKKTMISTAVLALLFVSCSSDDGLTQSTLPLEGTPIQVNVAVADLQTHAGYDASNLPTEFYIDVINPSNSKYSYKDIMMKFENGQWNSYVPSYKNNSSEDEKIQMLWAGDNNNVQVTARTFNLQNSENGSTTVSVQTDQYNAANFQKSDHLGMKKTTVPPSTNGIDVPFTHLMSKIKLEIELRDEFYATSTTDIYSVAINGTYPNATYSEETQECSVKKDDSPQAIDMHPSSALSQDSNKHSFGKYEVILMPQTIEANQFTVSFMVGDRKFEWTSTDAVTLESGKIYTLKLMAGKDIIVSSVSFSTSAWNNGDTISKETE